MADDLSFERRVLNQLDAIDRQLEQANERLAKGDRRMEKIEWHAAETANAVKIQNGRVGTLETKELARRLREERDAGREEGNQAGRQWSWKIITAALGIVTALASSAGAIVGIVVKVAAG